jgi:aspartate/methionine/tyrosine aminotransferase
MLSLKSLNPNILSARYAVRGPIVELAQDLESQGKEILYFNIGNPQQLGQTPLTFAREILSLVNSPLLLDKSAKLADLGFHHDSIIRAQEIMKLNPIGLGAYSQSAGMPFIRTAVAEFITRRDSIPASPKTIFITDGASKGVDLILNAFISKNVGIMTPIPQYPLYSADIALFGGIQVPYYLDEENDWALNVDMLSEAYKTAVNQGVKVKAIVVINPNNPTGSVLHRENIKQVLEFAASNDLMIIADEVYQENIYDPTEQFHSFAKVAYETKITIPIFSLHSTSKGFIGECGFRGGYLESRNVPEDVLQELLKVRSIGLCANTSGQIMTYLMVTPPKVGADSYDLYVRERSEILTGLARKSKAISNALENIDGIRCTTPKGAMYLFPKLDLPANKEYHGKPADYRFCEFLVKDAGIVTVPGSGFGQLPNTWHLRMTFLPPEDRIPLIMEKFESSYNKFVTHI